MTSWDTTDEDADDVCNFGRKTIRFVILSRPHRIESQAGSMRHAACICLQRDLPGSPDWHSESMVVTL